MTEDEMVGWHHRLDGHGFGWTPGVGDGQGALVCCRGHKESTRVSDLHFHFFRYADDTTLMAESKEELKSFLMRVKEENEKAGLKLNIQKTKIMASGPITSWQIDGENMETVTDYFLRLQNHCRS